MVIVNINKDMNNNNKQQPLPRTGGSRQVRDAAGVRRQDRCLRSPTAPRAGRQHVPAVKRRPGDHGVRLQPHPEPIQQATGGLRDVERSAMRLQGRPR